MDIIQLIAPLMFLYIGYKTLMELSMHPQLVDIPSSIPWLQTLGRIIAVVELLLLSRRRSSVINESFHQGEGSSLLLTLIINHNLGMLFCCFLLVLLELCRIFNSQITNA
jgi:hypothetical protein